MRFTGLAIFAIIAVNAVPAMAATSQPTLQDRQQAACADDAQKLCADAIPDVDKVTACMKGKKALVSPKCAAMWDIKQ